MTEKTASDEDAENDPNTSGGNGAAGGDQMTAGAKKGSILLALVIGAVGGTVFAWLQLPLPWMMGAMVFTTVAAISGANIRLPQRTRMIMITVLGVMLGSAFSPELMDRIGQWIVSIAGLFVYGIVAAGIVLLYFRRVANYDPVTAYFSSSPGGLNEMVIVGREMGGDDRVIALTHAARILLVVMILPFLFRIFGGYEPPEGLLPAGPGFDLPPHEWLLLGACAVIGPFIAKAMRLPAAYLVGPMVLSAVIHLTGWSEASLPSPLIAAAQVVLGCGVGCRFAGSKVPEVIRCVRVSIGSTVILLGSAVAMGFAVEELTGIPWHVVVLAYAPGGLAEMSIVALGIGQDVAFVATHHIFRIGMVVILAPLAFRMMRPFWTNGDAHPPPADR